MPSDQEIELAHPEAFDFVFGNLPPDATEEFNRHLDGCRYCQTIVTEYSDIGRIVQSLPPHVEPPADLEDRTVAAVLLAMAGQPIAIAARPRPINPPPAPRTWRPHGSTRYPRLRLRLPTIRRQVWLKSPPQSLPCLCGDVIEAD